MTTKIEVGKLASWQVTSSMAQFLVILHTTHHCVIAAVLYKQSDSESYHREQTWLHRLLAVWHSANYLLFLCFSLLLNKIVYWWCLPHRVLWVLIERNADMLHGIHRYSLVITTLEHKKDMLFYSLLQFKIIPHPSLGYYIIWTCNSYFSWTWFCNNVRCQMWNAC